MRAAVSHNTGRQVLVDCAGGHMGGARRYLDELDRWLVEAPGRAELCGQGRSVDARWLLEREIIAQRTRPSSAIALNNVSFGFARSTRVVLVRNALHFLEPGEVVGWSGLERVERAGRVVRASLVRAHRIVVPSGAMARRVIARMPSLADRLEVMHHPVSVSLPHRSKAVSGSIICPILDAPYKDLGRRIADAIRALDGLGGAKDNAELQFSVTLDVDEARAHGLESRPWLRLLGRLSTENLREELARSQVVYYPTTLESFGYPLAEAYVRRVPVVAPGSQLAHEVARDVLVPYKEGSSESLRNAFAKALDLTPAPITENPFDPNRYFARLFCTES